MTKLLAWFAGIVIPPWLLPLAAALITGALVWGVQGWRYGATIAKMGKANADSVLAFQQAARKQETDWNAKLQGAQNEAAKRETVIRADATRARASADGLRNEISEIRRQLPDLAAEASRVRADTFAGILGECVGEYQALAEKADRHVSDKQTLIDAWPTSTK